MGFICPAHHRRREQRARRVGVSARPAKTAVAQLGKRDVAEIEEVWHALAPPFAWIEGRGPAPDVRQAVVFRPLMLSHALEEDDWATLDLAQFWAEWKWDGIRVQIAGGSGETLLFARSGDDISGSFPDIVEGCRFDAVLDGELLVVRNGVVAPSAICSSASIVRGSRSGSLSSFRPMFGSTTSSWPMARTCGPCRCQNGVSGWRPGMRASIHCELTCPRSFPRKRQRTLLLQFLGPS
jgi:hypothetical protein